MSHTSIFICKTLIVFLLAVPAVAGHSQKLADGVFQRQVRFTLARDSVVTFSTYEVRDSAAFRALKIHETNFPVTIVKKPVVDPFFDLVLQYEAQLAEYQRLDKSYISLDSVQREKIVQLQRLTEIQNERVENYRKLADDMSSANAKISQQLNDALDLAKECNKGKVHKRLWAALVGGGVGFTLAGLIAFL